MSMTAVRGQYVPLGETMSDTQGLRPFDPYRTLQLHPAAPRDLIEKVYWFLASSVHSSPVSSSRVQDLNDAYATLVNESARQSYDEAHGVRPLTVAAPPSRAPRGGWFSAKKPAVDYADYYHLLRIDREADSRIIQLAYEFWSHGVQSQRVQRERMEEAHRTLSNPQLRAQYDARRQEAPPPKKVKITKQVHDQIQNARHNETESTRSTRIAATADPQPDASAPAPSPVQPAPEVPVSANGRRIEPVVPPDLEPPAAARVEPAAPPTRVESATQPAVEPAPARVEPAAIAHEPALAEPAVAAAVDAPAATIPAPLPAPKQLGGRQLADAQHNRLLQLREDVPAPIDAVPALLPHALEQQLAAATLAFIAGPRAGERVDLVGDVMTLGSAAACDIVLKDDYAEIEPEHARLMRRGATYMFRDIAGHDTAITDSPLPLAVVMLEDGDEIQIGEHRMRFATAEASDRPETSAVAAELPRSPGRQLRPETR